MLAATKARKSRKMLRKTNEGEWTRKVEFRNPRQYNLLRASKGEPLGSGFSTERALISASAVPHCGMPVGNPES